MKRVRAFVFLSLSSSVKFDRVDFGVAGKAMSLVSLVALWGRHRALFMDTVVNLLALSPSPRSCVMFFRTRGCWVGRGRWAG